MSQNPPHPPCMRGARPKVRGVCRPNEAERQANMQRPSIDAMQEEVEKHLRIYEKLINECAAPPPGDRGGPANYSRSGNSNVALGGFSPYSWRSFRPTTAGNRQEYNEPCLYPPFSSFRPPPRGPCPGTTGIAGQPLEFGAEGRRRSWNEFPAMGQAPLPSQTINLGQAPLPSQTINLGQAPLPSQTMNLGQPPLPSQTMSMLPPANPTAWQSRMNNLAAMSGIFPRSEERQRPQTAQVQASRLPDRLPEEAKAVAQVHSHHGHYPQNLALDPAHQPSLPRGASRMQPTGNEMEAHLHHDRDLDHRGHDHDHLGHDHDHDHDHDHHDHDLEHDHHHHHHKREPVERDEKTVSALLHLSQFRKTPSYEKCEKKGSLDFLDVCNRKEEDAKKAPTRGDIPRIPCLQENALNNLISCEQRDVESALYLVSDERKTYKKPCPKQQKAQMTVQALVHAHANLPCGKEYSPMEHPDPDDISPEVAAAMMFCQEQGINLAGCPKNAINFLFPEESKPPFPEKIPPGNISVVDPDKKQQEEMIEQSANVSAEGVSDSAYTRTMKGKGEDVGPQRSYDVDFAVGQTKREYVLVAQKPQRVNKAQFRGVASPSWFPGYFSAFPDEDGTLKLVPSPSRLLHKAWFHAKPVNIPTSDVIVVD